MRCIEWSDKARKQLRRIPAKDQVLILRSVDRLADFPDCLGDIKKLQGLSGFRLRVGRYRVIFNEDGLVLEIKEVKKRDDRTYS